jgi:hypothetical protein
MVFKNAKVELRPCLSLDLGKISKKRIGRVACISHPELLDGPCLWQQTGYVLEGGSSNLMFLVLTTDKLLNK